MIFLISTIWIWYGQWRSISNSNRWKSIIYCTSRFFTSITNTWQKKILIYLKESFHFHIQVSVELRLPRPESPPPSLPDSLLFWFNSINRINHFYFSFICIYNLRVWDRVTCVYGDGCLKFKLELSLVNLFVSRIFVTWWLRWWWWWWWVDSVNDESPVVVDELLNNGDAELGTDVFERLDDVDKWNGRFGVRFLIWWLLSVRRSNLLTASGDCVPRRKKRNIHKRKDSNDNEQK